METQLIPYLLACIVLTGLFAGMDMAFVSANKFNLELRKKQNSFSGRLLTRLLRDPAEFTGTRLVAVSMALVVFCVLFARFTRPVMAHLPGPMDSDLVRFLFNTIAAMLIIVFLGEFLPKAYARSRGEQVMLLFALPVIGLYFVLYPVAKIFVSVSSFILKYLFNVRVKENEEVFRRVDMEHFMKQTVYGHETESNELNTELFENALNLVHTRVRRCMVPRKEVEGVDLSTPIAEVRQRFVDTKLSKIIVYDGTIDNIVGYIHHLDLNRRPSEIREVLHSISAVPEAMSAIEVMNQFTRERKSIAWVIDEFGGTAGVVTMEDVLEKIFGEIYDEYDTQVHVDRQIAEHEYVFSGRLELDHLNEKYGFNFPLGGAETISGYIISNYGTIPKIKERIFIDRYEFDILLVSDTRIETVKMKVLQL
jgi:putative hemolysin